jgi:hypothetical protein
VYTNLRLFPCVSIISNSLLLYQDEGEYDEFLVVYFFTTATSATDMNAFVGLVLNSGWIRKKRMKDVKDEG